MQGNKQQNIVSVGSMELLSGEANNIMHTEIKDKIQKENYRRLRQLTSSKLNGRNTIRAINSWVVSIVRYSAGILKWTKDELKVMDRKTQKIMTLTDCTFQEWKVDEDS